MADLERFLIDVRDHQMQVIHVNGIHRHLRFRKPGRSEYWFDLVTWPGALCINGDCGTYVFARIEDMFQFFRTEPGGINPSYWSEKCVAACVTDGIRKFDPDGFTRRVVQRFRDHWRDGDRHERRLCFTELRNDVLDYVDETSEDANFGLLASFKFGDFQFDDYYEIRAQKYTFRFIWCLRAIVWGIQRYDDYSAEQARLLGVETAHG